MIDDRMRGPGHGTTCVWVYDERRRVRDGMPGQLGPLLFLGTVEVLHDATRPMAQPGLAPTERFLPGTQLPSETRLHLYS